MNRQGAPAELVQADAAGVTTMQPGFKGRDAAYASLGTADQPGGAQWEQQCQGLFAAILNVGGVALDRMQAYAAQNQADAIRRMVISGSVLTVAGVLLAGSVFLVRGRVIAPVHQITVAIRRLAANDISTEVAPPKHHDEFGAMAT